MSEYTIPFVRQGYYIDSQNIRLDLYRLLTAFFSSRNLSTFSTGNGSNDPIGSLVDEFEESEIVRTIINIAVCMRIEDDQNDRYIDRFKTNTGVLIPDLKKPTRTAILTLREACNKIIHAKSMKFDVDHDENNNKYLNPFLYLYGEKGEQQWKAILKVQDFVHDVSTVLR